MYGTNEGENTNEYADEPAKQDGCDEPRLFVFGVVLPVALGRCWRPLRNHQS